MAGNNSDPFGMMGGDSGTWVYVLGRDFVAVSRSALDSERSGREKAMAELAAERKAHEATKADLAAMKAARDQDRQEWQEANNEASTVRDILEQALGVPRYQYRFRLSELARMLSDSDKAAKEERDAARQAKQDMRAGNAAANARLAKMGEALEKALGLDPAEPHELDAMVGELIEGYKERTRLVLTLQKELQRAQSEALNMKRAICNLVNSLPTEAF